MFILAADRELFAVMKGDLSQAWLALELCTTPKAWPGQFYCKFNERSSVAYRRYSAEVALRTEPNTVLHRSETLYSHPPHLVTNLPTRIELKDNDYVG